MQAGKAMKPYRILLVDDDEMLIRLLERTLQKHGYHVETAVDGLDGLEKALQIRPDLLVLDIVMPRMDGYELCHRLKNHPATADTPILSLTSLGSEGGPTLPIGNSEENIHAYRQQALAVGANDFLPKPIMPQSLLNRIQMLTSPQETV